MKPAMLVLLMMAAGMPCWAAEMPYNLLVEKKLNEATQTQKLTISAKEKAFLVQHKKDWFGFTVDPNGKVRLSEERGFKYPATMKLMLSTTKLPAPADKQTQDLLARLSASGKFDVDFED